ncbi:GAF domain-containing protein [Lysobacter sp. MMG2]|uniref:hybrid sensor histidine kinase/response regulator n=1 Tax=Lysobacter sp. MMG2 TaxID=2801338 RepID=UPI001C2108D3|nr:ATP-binding protein [Lysobacter sp. MMG2]MBU8977841.1 GAF domain-containing protein [Lysobacter sp. MMG2]
MDTPVSPAAAIITPELDRRPARPPDHLAESRALVALMKALKAPDASILHELAETALRLCHAGSAGISLASEHEGPHMARWRACAGRWSPFLRDTIPRGITPDPAAPLLIRHPELHADDAREGAPALHEALLVPFEVAGQRIGTVWVVHHEPAHAFDREDVRLLQDLGDVAALAFQAIEQQQQLRDALDRQIAGSHLLQSVSVGLISEDDIGPLYAQILEAAMTIMRAQFASLQRVDRNGELQLLASSGFHPESARYWQVITMESASSCAQTLRERDRFFIADAEEAAELVGAGNLAEYRRSGIRAMQSTPLISRKGKLVGVISTHWREPYALVDSDLRLFDVLARETADLIERTNAEAALREADRRKDEFLAVLGHELRNPLAPLSTGIELLQRAGRDPALTDSIHAMMKRQLVHLTRLVDDLLDLSRITTGKIELRREPIDLRVVIEAAVELTRPLMEQRGHCLTVEHHDTLLPVHGDLERLTQVVANLLGNAAKYMESGGRITLRSAAEGEQAVLRVSDTGFGIPADRIDEVFEMFSQVPEHRERRGGGGLGIGLALSRRLVELHGGTLKATSPGAGQGSEFVVRLPLGIVAPSAKRDAGIRKAAAAPRRVLIVDDNVDAALSLQAALELDGHVVDVAHDGPSSLGLLEHGDPEVLLLDIGLPLMDGYQLARRIRERPGGDGLLLVAITGWGQAGDRERARQAGFDVHMTKPISLDVLSATLERGKPV